MGLRDQNNGKKKGVNGSRIYHVTTLFKGHGPHIRNDKSECQECTCKIDKSLNRRMCIKFESRKICVAGNQCDNSDFDFHNAEHKELPVIKISSDEGREDCQQLKPKGTQASFGNTVIAVTINNPSPKAKLILLNNP